MNDLELQQDICVICLNEVDKALPKGIWKCQKCTCYAHLQCNNQHIFTECPQCRFGQIPHEIVPCHIFYQDAVANSNIAVADNLQEYRVEPNPRRVNDQVQQQLNDYDYRQQNNKSRCKKLNRADKIMIIGLFVNSIILIGSIIYFTQIGYQDEQQQQVLANKAQKYLDSNNCQYTSQGHVKRFYNTLECQQAYITTQIISSSYVGGIILMVIASVLLLFNIKFLICFKGKC